MVIRWRVKVEVVARDGRNAVVWPCSGLLWLRRLGRVGDGIVVRWRWLLVVGGGVRWRPGGQPRYRRGGGC